MIQDFLLHEEAKERSHLLKDKMFKKKNNVFVIEWKCSQSNLHRYSLAYSN